MAAELYGLAKNDKTVTISAGSALSSAIRLDYHGVMAMIFTKASAWSGSADVTFAVSLDDSTYYPLYKDDGTEVSIANADFALSRYIDLPPDVFGKGFKYLKVRSGTSASPVNQATNPVTVTLITRPL